MVGSVTLEKIFCRLGCSLEYWPRMCSLLWHLTEDCGQLMFRFIVT